MAELTQEENIAKDYSGMLDCAFVIDAIQGRENGEFALLIRENKEETHVEKNIKHIEIMLTRDYWTDEDLTVFDKYFE